MADLVYTYVGDVLISVNPFKNTGIYNSELKKVSFSYLRGALVSKRYGVLPKGLC